MDKKKVRNILGILFGAAAVCFLIGTINHIVHTGEGTVSSVCMTMGCALMSVACLWKNK